MNHPTDAKEYRMGISVGRDFDVIGKTFKLGQELRNIPL